MFFAAIRIFVLPVRCILYINKTTDQIGIIKPRHLINAKLYCIKGDLYTQ